MDDDDDAGGLQAPSQFCLRINGPAGWQTAYGGLRLFTESGSHSQTEATFIVYELKEKDLNDWFGHSVLHSGRHRTV